MKRFASFVFAVLLLLFINIAPARAEDAAIPFTVPAADGYGLDLECASAAAQFYFVWDRPPGPWTLTAFDGSGGETAYACGEDGFIHEYVKLDFPASKFRFTFSYGGASDFRAKAYAFGEGEPPGWVERWLPPCEKADLLVVPARPGDEYFYFGGVIPYYADKGKNIQVVYAFHSGEELPSEMHGFLSGLYLGGARNYPLIEAFGGDKGADAYTAEYIEQIRRFKPEVTLGPYAGAYSEDAVRKAAGEALAAAADAAGNASEHPESAQLYGVWDVPKIYLHGLAENETVMDWNVPLESFGGRTAFSVAQEALREQFPEDGIIAEISDDPGDSGRFGLYRSAVGPDLTGGDLFENIIQAAPEDGPGEGDAAAGGPEDPVPTIDIPPEAAPPADMAGEPANAGYRSRLVPFIGGAAVLCLILAFLLRSRRGI